MRGLLLRHSILNEMPYMEHENALKPRNTSPSTPAMGVRATTKQMCDCYQVSRTTWWRWSNTKGFPPAIRFGRSVRWDSEAINAFLTQQEG